MIIIEWTTTPTGALKIFARVSTINSYQSKELVTHVLNNSTETQMIKLNVFKILVSMAIHWINREHAMNWIVGMDIHWTLLMVYLLRALIVMWSVMITSFTIRIMLNVHRQIGVHLIRESMLMDGNVTPLHMVYHQVGLVIKNNWDLTNLQILTYQWVTKQRVKMITIFIAHH